MLIDRYLTQGFKWIRQAWL